MTDPSHTPPGQSPPADRADTAMTAQMPSAAGGDAGRGRPSAAGGPPVPPAARARRSAAKPAAWPVIAGTAGAFFAALAFLAGEVADGRDPALGPVSAATPAPKPRQIVVQRIVRRVVIHHPAPRPAAPVATGGAAPAPVASAGGAAAAAAPAPAASGGGAAPAAAPPAAPAAAPAPAPAAPPPAPLTTQSS